MALSAFGPRSARTGPPLAVGSRRCGAMRFVSSPSEKGAWPRANTILGEISFPLGGTRRCCLPVSRRSQAKADAVIPLSGTKALAPFGLGRRAALLRPGGVSGYLQGSHVPPPGQRWAALCSQRGSRPLFGRALSRGGDARSRGKTSGLGPGRAYLQSMKALSGNKPVFSCLSTGSRPIFLVAHSSGAGKSQPLSPRWREVPDRVGLPERGAWMAAGLSRGTAGGDKKAAVARPRLDRVRRRKYHTACLRIVLVSLQDLRV